MYKYKSHGVVFWNIICGKDDHEWDGLVLNDKVNMKKKQRPSAEQSQMDLAFLHQRHRKVSLIKIANDTQLLITLFLVESCI